MKVERNWREEYEFGGKGDAERRRPPSPFWGDGQTRHGVSISRAALSLQPFFWLDRSGSDTLAKLMQGLNSIE